MHEPLLRAIIDDPDDIAARRVYGDALLASGESRGEFIQVHCDLAELDDADPRAHALDLRWLELKRDHEARWTAPYGDRIRCYFSGGMIDDVTGTATDVLEAGDLLFEREPVVQLGLDTVPREAVMPLSHLPALRRIRRLRVNHCALGPAEVRALLGAEDLSLRELSLRFGCAMDGRKRAACAS